MPAAHRRGAREYPSRYLSGTKDRGATITHGKGCPSTSSLLGDSPFHLASRISMTLLVTPLNAAHRAAGAKMVDFGGWDMPVNYGSQIEEHHAVRTDVGMFD